MTVNPCYCTLYEIEPIDSSFHIFGEPAIVHSIVGPHCAVGLNGCIEASYWEFTLGLKDSLEDLPNGISYNEALGAVVIAPTSRVAF